MRQRIQGSVTNEIVSVCSFYVWECEYDVAGSLGVRCHISFKGLDGDITAREKTWRSIIGLALDEGVGRGSWKRGGEAIGLGLEDA